MHVRDRNCFQKPVLLIVMRFWIRILSIKWQNTTTENSQSAPMAIFGYPEIFFFTFTFSTILLTAVLRSRSWRKSSVPTNWPLVGMLPWLLRISRRVHSSVTQLMNECGGTFELKGPWFCNMDMLITSDPANIHHIFSRNFSNYPKGQNSGRFSTSWGMGFSTLILNCGSFTGERLTRSSVTPRSTLSLEGLFGGKWKWTLACS
ncbi:hypothetical protein Sango_1348800 [Sesamum angolense]|uniref:Cytochrome P450 n=1 Tax=Sesamum angolense TaxID=2727404 RepID=A0AAE2BV32_9LAMI|nr:hypothetical protein Sango_1348800 [Sesamum angolense]